MFEKEYRNGVTVTVGKDVVSARDKDGEHITSSNVFFYYAEWGYDLNTEEEVADQFYINYCSGS